MHVRLSLPHPAFILTPSTPHTDLFYTVPNTARTLSPPSLCLGPLCLEHLLHLPNHTTPALYKIPFIFQHSVPRPHSEVLPANAPQSPWHTEGYLPVRLLPDHIPFTSVFLGLAEVCACGKQLLSDCCRISSENGSNMRPNDPSKYFFVLYLEDKGRTHWHPIWRYPSCLQIVCVSPRPNNFRCSSPLKRWLHQSWVFVLSSAIFPGKGLGTQYMFVS